MRRPRTAGFSLIEVVAAMTIAVILVLTASSALLTALRGEETAEHFRQASLLIPTLAATHWLGLAEPAPDAFAGWTVAAGSQTDSDADEPVEWRIWDLAPDGRPSLPVRVALRVP